MLNGSNNWAHVDCGLCLKLKAKISAAHEASEAAIVEQMGDMAAYVRAGMGPNAGRRGD
ncbi:hypothetical protein ACI77O_12625 [Pseudomonas tritici]|uniref:hypothetical protein n=1 Tax=Pseudomonas tritici TaxID=2745518 RepID=UPI00387B080E